MKILYSYGKLSVGIVDEIDFVVFDNTKPKISKRNGVEHISYDYSYYRSPNHALLKMAKMTANSDCTDLASWVKIYKESIKRIEIACGLK